MSSTHWMVGGGLCLAGLLLAGAAPAQAGDPLARLEAAVRAHPEDPDLLYALARERLEHGEAEAAAALFGRYVERFPGHHPHAERELGRALLEADRAEDAAAALERATRSSPQDAEAWLLLGIALRSAGEVRRAERPLARAAQIDSSLEAESLMLRGLGRLERGDDRSARRLFRELMAVQPGSEIAARAEQLLARGEPAPRVPRRRFSLGVEAGVEWDSNVTLESGTDLPGLSGPRRDWRVVLGAAALWRPQLGERSGLALGYRYDQTEHDELGEFDLQGHTLHAALSHAPGERVGVRLDLWGTSSHLHYDRYLRTAGARPNLFLAFARGAGVMRIYAEAERRSYHEDVSLASLERDGWFYGSGVEHNLDLGADGERQATLGARYGRSDTDGDRDVFGFDTAFDHHLVEATVVLRSPIALDVDGELALGFGYEDYTRKSVVDFLTEGGVGTLLPRTRRDRVFDARLALRRPLGERMDVEVAWRRFERDSNVDLYRYDRDVLGLYLRAHAF